MSAEEEARRIVEAWFKNVSDRGLHANSLASEDLLVASLAQALTDKDEALVQIEDDLQRAIEEKNNLRAALARVEAERDEQQKFWRNTYFQAAARDRQERDLAKITAVEEMKMRVAAEADLVRYKATIAQFVDALGEALYTGGSIIPQPVKDRGMALLRQHSTSPAAIALAEKTETKT